MLAGFVQIAVLLNTGFGIWSGFCFSEDPRKSQNDPRSTAKTAPPATRHMSSVFLVVKPSKILFLYEILYSKRRIESYSMLGTIVSPNEILLT